MAKFVLEITEEDVVRIALYTPLKGYKLMYFVNKKIGSYFIRLTREKDLGYYKDEQTQEYFEVFKWNDKTYYQKWFCIKNKLKKEERNLTLNTLNPVSYWDKKYKKADFILELEEVRPNFEIEMLMTQLREIPEMIYVQEI